MQGCLLHYFPKVPDGWLRSSVSHPLCSRLLAFLQHIQSHTLKVYVNLLPHLNFRRTTPGLTRSQYALASVTKEALNF